MKLSDLKMQELNAQELKEVEGGGDLVRAVWYIIGMVGGAYGNAIENEKKSWGIKP